MFIALGSVPWISPKEGNLGVVVLGSLRCLFSVRDPLEWRLFGVVSLVSWLIVATVLGWCLQSVVVITFARREQPRKSAQLGAGSKTILILLLTIAIWNCGCRRSQTKEEESASACMLNLQEAYWALRVRLGDGYRFPASLSSLAETTTNSAIFVCPGSGHEAGAMTNVEDWTDFIYVGNHEDIQDPDFALLISPPENHGGRFGLVLWHGGNVVRLSPEQTRRLIEAPWFLATNAPNDHIEGLKRILTVQVPKRFENLYTNAWRSAGSDR